MLAGAGLAYRYARLPVVITMEQGTSVRKVTGSWPTAVSVGDAKLWSVFSPQQQAGSRHSGDGAAQAGSLASRFRLAGTFFWSGKDNSVTVRKAIIDNLETKEGHIVAEGSFMGDVEVVRVLKDSVLLRANGREEELRLSYIPVAPKQANAATSNEWLKLAENETVMSTNLYGAQVGDNRWVMSREKFEEYCVQMEEHPARLAALFDSMQPVYETDPNTAARRITGYKLQMQGEQEFYGAVGLKEGDVVTGVNMMPMTSKRRAMFWIDQFRQGQVNSFMFDVIRDGKPTQLQYMIR